MLKIYFLILTCVNSGLALFTEDVPLFHEHSKTVIRPTSAGGYFGYTVLLKNGNPFEVLVGAPKATGEVSRGRPGALYRCALTLTDGPANVSCAPHHFTVRSRKAYSLTSVDHIKDDMWLGASLTDVTEDTLLVCAPRWSVLYRPKYPLIEGLCFVLSKNQAPERLLLSDERERREYKREEYTKKYGRTLTPLNFYEDAQTGMSVKVSGNRSSLIVGAPGLMFLRGGVVEYRLKNEKWIKNDYRIQSITIPTVNTYRFSQEYFGYSVDTGVFEPDGDTLYVAGAPRGLGGLGRVVIFKPSEKELLIPTIKGTLDGPQLGSYFGASVVCADLDGDGRADVLVGAPNYASQDDKFSHDQGAVYVYLTRPERSRFKSFILHAAGSVRGSGADGAHFGSAIAALGDVDGDGHPEVAVGAPWEEGGRGAVYVYSGHAHGLRTAHVQRISPSGARGFGMSISRGLDVDTNGCNDLAVGAHASDETYLFRCVPTIKVKASIEVPNAEQLTHNVTNFTALFCVSVDPATAWPKVNLELNATILVDKSENRAYLIGASEYKIQALPKFTSCEKRTLVIRENSDLSRPINLVFDLVPQRAKSPLFSSNKARLSDSSETHIPIKIPLAGDCGEDLICQPQLTVQLKDLGSSPYIPGTGDKVGVIATLYNAGEPAYGAVVNFSLPAEPKRVPSSCEMSGSNMTCKLPSPLNRGKKATYVIELAYVQKSVEEEGLNFTAEVKHSLNTAQATQTIQKLTLKVLPTANITVKGKVLPNATLHITREQFSAGELIQFVHYFEITNFGPSDWPYLDAELQLANWTSLSSGVLGCKETASGLNCSFDVPAHVSSPLELPLTFDLNENGGKLEENGFYEATTVLTLKQHSIDARLTTRLVLQAPAPLWPLIVGVLVGLLLLLVILYVLKKRGFFTRKRPQRLQETGQGDSSVGLDQPADAELAEERN